MPIINKNVKIKFSYEFKVNKGVPSFHRFCIDQAESTVVYRQFAAVLSKLLCKFLRGLIYCLIGKIRFEKKNQVKFELV